MSVICQTSPSGQLQAIFFIFYFFPSYLLSKIEAKIQYIRQEIYRSTLSIIGCRLVAISDLVGLSLSRLSFLIDNVALSKKAIQLRCRLAFVGFNFVTNKTPAFTTVVDYCWFLVVGCRLFCIGCWLTVSTSPTFSIVGAQLWDWPCSVTAQRPNF